MMNLGKLFGKNLTAAIGNKIFTSDSISITTNGDNVGGTVIVNGEVVEINNKTLTIEILSGTVENVEAKGHITCQDITGKASAGMNISARDIHGRTDAGMNITASGDIHGDADAGMSIKCRDIMGNADAGMDIKTSSVKGRSNGGF